MKLLGENSKVKQNNLAEIQKRQDKSQAEAINQKDEKHGTYKMWYVYMIRQMQHLKVHKGGCTLKLCDISSGRLLGGEKNRLSYPAQ